MAICLRRSDYFFFSDLSLFFFLLCDLLLRSLLRLFELFFTLRSGLIFFSLSVASFRSLRDLTDEGILTLVTFPRERALSSRRFGVYKSFVVLVADFFLLDDYRLLLNVTLPKL